MANSEDYLLAAVGGAIKGFSEGYLPFAKAKYENDLLTQRKKQAMDEEFEQKKAMAQFEANLKPQPKTIGEIYANNSLRPAEYTPDLDPLTPELAAPIVRLRDDKSASARMEATAQKEEEQKRKEEAAKKKLIIPGFVSDDSVTIDETEAKKLRDGLAEYETFKQGLQQYQDLIKKYGTTEVVNRDVANEMEALAKNLQLKVKNLAQLGVLSFSDIPFIEKQIPAPGILKTQSGMLGALGQTEKQFRNSFKNQMKSRGLTPTEEASTRLGLIDLPVVKSNTASGLKAGTVEDGYQFLGGDPADEKNWKKI